MEFPRDLYMGPMLFLIYINDMLAELSTYMNLFADGAKILKHIKDLNYCKELQKDLNILYAWRQPWKMEFNTKKCHVLEVRVSSKRPRYEYKSGRKL